MNPDAKHNRLETEAIIVGYAMSRLDTRYPGNRGAQPWKKAFEEAAEILSVPSSSIKNLRDEFDPYLGNQRMTLRNRE